MDHVESRKAKRIIVNPSYDGYNVNNDIAIVQLSSPVTLTNRIQLACLPPSGQSTVYPPVNQPAWIVGWGYTSENGLVSNKLQNVKITIYNGATYCKNVASAVGIQTIDWNSHICAGYYYYYY